MTVAPWSGCQVAVIGYAISPVSGWQVAAAGYVIAWAALVACGWSARKEAGGSPKRFVWVTGCLAFMGAAPLLVWAIEVTLVPQELNAGPCLAMLATVSVLLCVTPPVRLRGTRQKLPRVDDPKFLARLAELAKKMGAPVPLVRLWPSVSGSQQMLAFAGTLPAPQIVVTDGIMHRLSPTESDVIVAHELAHIANRSLWPLFGIIPLVCCVATGMLPFFPPSFVVAFGFALAVGLRRFVSRPIELDCDRRAARAIGFPETARALAKIHAAHLVRNSGLLSLLVYATATHPSRDMRLWALQTAAPDADKPAIPVDRVAIRRHRLTAATATMIWVVVMVGSMITQLSEIGNVWPAITLSLTAISPFILMALAKQKQTALTRRRLGRRSRWIAVGGIALSLVILTALIAVTLPQQSGAFLPAVSIAALVMYFGLVLVSIVFLFWTRKIRKLRSKVLVALQIHDFRGALELGLANPKLVAGDKLLRYNVGLAQAVCGDREKAIADLEQLWRDKPKFPIAANLLNVLLLDSDRSQQALDVALEVAPQLTGDVATHVMAARALRRLGRLDEARAACDRGLALEPHDPALLGMSAALALDRMEFAEAQRLIDRALERGPAESFLLIVRAEIAVQTLPVEQARAIVAETVASVRANPLVFLQHDLALIERALAAKAAVTSAPAVP